LRIVKVKLDEKSVHRKPAGRFGVTDETRKSYPQVQKPKPINGLGVDFLG
jgi:hypothetical protein